MARMYIRKTKIKTGSQGEPYYTYRLVQSVRTGKTVKQRTVINLGKNFAIEPEHWPMLTVRIEQILNGQTGQVALFDLTQEIGEALEAKAQRYAALIIQKYAQPVQTPASDKADDPLVEADFQTIDLHQIDLLQPRTLGGEALAYQAMEQLQLRQKLGALGFNSPDLAAAIGSIIGRMINPGSERDTHRWLQNNTALGELIDHDFGTTSLTRLYTVADQLLKHQSAIEDFLYQREEDIFQLSRTLVLYDLTNTYFEGQALGNAKAQFGRSKEKRSDCPLVTLGLVLDGDGFPIHSRVFAGNASEPATLEEMITGLHKPSEGTIPTVVLDAGLASQENIDWLTTQGYQYIVVSREKYKEKPDEDDGAVVVKSAQGNQVIAKRVDCPESGEVRLYCHSTLREKKDSAIRNRFGQRFEEALGKLNEGLDKKGTIKRYDKIIERIGRLKEKNSRVASDYRITVIGDENKDKALRIEWQRSNGAAEKDKQSGVYCLRTNVTTWTEAQLWETYVMLTELEASFRSMKTELGLRPIYHQKEKRVTAHLFITLLAYHIVHTIRYQLKKQDIHFSWQSIRDLMSSQQRITISMQTQTGEQIHLRTTSRAEAHQQRIYQALVFSSDLIGKRRMTVENPKKKSVVPTHS